MTNMFNTKDCFDVAVIGAGMAGIVAARDLSAKGHTVVLLEARNRVGGRTYMKKAFDGKIDLDMGGTYVHWTQPHVWHELQRHNISVLPALDGDKIYWLADDKVHSGNRSDWEKAVRPLLDRFFADARARFPLPFEASTVDNSDIEKQSLEDRFSSLNLCTYERDLLDGVFSGVAHSYKEQGLAQLLQGVATYFGDYFAFLETAGFWHIQGGTKALIDAILAESTADLRLSTPVSSISDNGSHVTVTTISEEKIHARSVIVALPLNTIGDLKITPDVPPAVRAMIDQKNPVMSSKIWIRVKGEIEPFSYLAPIGKSPINAVKAESWYEGDTLLVAMCSEAAAIRIDDRDAMEAALRRVLPDIEVVSTAGHCWVTDEFSKGAWMMHRPGNLLGAAPQMRQPHGRIQFAGGDISAMDAGSIEGAMESGASAARDIARALASGKY